MKILLIRGEKELAKYFKTGPRMISWAKENRTVVHYFTEITNILEPCFVGLRSPFVVVTYIGNLSIDEREREISSVIQKFMKKNGICEVVCPNDYLR